MKVIKKGCRLTALALVSVLLLSHCVGCGNSRSSAADLSGLQKEPVAYSALRDTGTKLPESAATMGLSLVQQNDFLMLYYNEKSAAVAVFDKRNGMWWHSNPASTDSIAARSQISVSTMSSKGVVKQYTSYADCLMKNQVTFDKKNGLTVTYTFGDPQTDLEFIAHRLTDERYDELIKRIGEAGGDKGLIKRRYTYKDGVWILKATLTNEQMKKLRELFELIGYTDEERMQDNAGSSLTSENDSFVIPLTYALEGDSLRAYIDGEKMVYPENEIITSLDVLEYFGSLLEDEAGYLFIPDGSGALVDSKQYGGVSNASLPLYGVDDTMPQKGASTTGVCLLPVFGISRPDGGVLTIIEDNEAVASVDVVKPGYVDEFATVSAAFAINSVQNIGLSNESVSKFYVTSDTRYKGDTALRYVFLDKKDASYSGMAGVYRDYLDATTKRTLQAKQDAIPFFLETVGAVKTQTSTLGIVHDTVAPLTTYKDNVMLLQKLKDAGVEDVALILTGWMNGGVDTGLPDDVELLDALGGRDGFSSLNDWAKENNVSVYPQVLLNSFSADESLMTKNAYAAYSLDSKKSFVSQFDAVTGTPLPEAKRHLLSPVWQRTLSEKLGASLRNYGSQNVNLGDIATTVYSDYHSQSEALRQTARLQSKQIIAQYAEDFEDVLLTAPNDLTANYSRLYTDVPKSSSSLSMAMCSVPFYQMVYHGYANYSFTAMNYDVDITQSMLKCAEYGGCPKFQFVASLDEYADFTGAAEYYASNYEAWLDDAGDVYSYLNDLLTPLANARMIGHSSLAEGVYRTDYDNGMAVYVNYTKAAVTVDGVTIDAQSAIRKEGV